MREKNGNRYFTLRQGMNLSSTLSRIICGMHAKAKMTESKQRQQDFHQSTPESKYVAMCAPYYFFVQHGLGMHALLKTSFFTMHQISSSSDNYRCIQLTVFSVVTARTMGHWYSQSQTRYEEVISALPYISGIHLFQLST